ncbi:MAG TPA: CDP-alcohol phosphatidyltransferase family protein [Micromonosporaceae bacterium]
MASGPRTSPAAGYRSVLTVPNLFTFLRLAGVVVFIYLALGPHADGWAVAVLALGGTSDWVDGFLARRLHQVSRLGELLDPVADRLYIVATVIVLTVRGVVPLWFTLALLGREAVLGLSLLVLRRYGYGPPPVHYVGKTATFILLVALPTLLLAAAVHSTAWWAHPAGWSLAWWGLVLYWVAALFYVAQTVGVVRTAARTRP